MKRRKRKTYDRDLFEIRASVTVELSINIREKAALEKRIICEVDTTNKVTRRVLHGKPP